MSDKKDRPKKHRPKKHTASSSIFQAHDDVFETANEMVVSMDALICFLKRHYSKGKLSVPLSTIGFILERLDVKFTHDVRDLEIQTEFARNTVTVLAPEIRKETMEARAERRSTILRDFLPTMKEAQIRATVQLYRTLKAGARRELVDNFSETIKRRRAI